MFLHDYRGNGRFRFAWLSKSLWHVYSVLGFDKECNHIYRFKLSITYSLKLLMLMLCGLSMFLVTIPPYSSGCSTLVPNSVFIIFF
jgi:hypothetical protein